EPTELRLRPSEEGADRHGIAHVGRNDERPRAGRLSRQRRRLQEVLATAGEDDRVALSQQGKRDGPADSASGARDDGDLVRRSHVETSVFPDRVSLSGPAAGAPTGYCFARAPIKGAGATSGDR